MQVEVKILRATIATGVALEPGEQAFVSEADAELLCRMGKAERITPVEETPAADQGALGEPIVVISSEAEPA